MTHENGGNFKTEYIRAMLKKTNISLAYRKNAYKKDSTELNDVIRDKPIKAVIKLRRPVSLETHLVGVKGPEKTVTFREPMTVSGNRTMARKSKQADERSASTERAVSDKQRPNSENNPNVKESGEVSPRPRPRTYERAEAALPRFGTIRRSYEPDKKFKPLAVFRAFERTPDIEQSDGAENDSVRELGLSPGSDLYSEADVNKPFDENFPIAKFPPIEMDEITKHRQMNAEAELTSKHRPPNPYESYLKRLKLERKAVSPSKPREQTKVKKKPVMKRVQTKARWLKEFKEEPVPEKPEPPLKVHERERNSKLLLDFKYSHAVEQYYGTQIRNSVNFSPMSDSFVNYSFDDDTEVKNGWIVKTLGANVLNLQARTLPSCNPIEARMRRQLARERAMLSKKQSIVSQASFRSHESHEALLKLRKLSVARRESGLSNAFLDESSSSGAFETEHARLNNGRKSVDSQTGLPEIRIDRVEHSATRSLNSSPNGPEYLRKMSNSHPKIISLNLPSVVMEDT